MATINHLGVVLSTVNQKLSDIHYIRGIHWNNIWIRPIYTAYARPGLLLTGRRPFFYGPGREAVKTYTGAVCSTRSIHNDPKTCCLAI